MVFFASARLARKQEGGWVSEGEVRPFWSQDLSDIRDFLMKAKLRGNTRRLNILPVARGGKTRLEGFKKITIQESICEFEPQRKYLESMAKAYDKISQRYGKEKVRFTTEEIEGIEDIVYDQGIYGLRKIEDQLNIRKRQVKLMSKSAEMWGWSLHDEGWQREWKKLVEKCGGLIPILKRCGLTQD